MSLKLCWFLFMGISLGTLVAQTPISEAARKADFSPAWPGCEPKIAECTKSRLSDFIAANLQVPPEAQTQGAGGVVMIEFVIEKNGTIGEVRTMRDPGMGMGDEAIRVISLMKAKKIKWTPAEENGKRIPFLYVTSVSFNLSMPPKEKPVEAPEFQVSPDHVYEIADEMPLYVGCIPGQKDSIDCTFKMMLEHIRTNLRYPEEALKMRTQGQVVVEFIIDRNGEVSSPVVLQGIGFGCDEEALRVITSMPRWTPGKQDGQVVAVKMKIPVYFQLPKEKD